MRLTILVARLFWLVCLSIFLISCTEAGIQVNDKIFEAGATQTLEFQFSQRDQSAQYQENFPKFNQHIKFHNLSSDHGLSQNTVNVIAEDNLGFLWFGTVDGLNRFDGYEFKIYKHDPTDPTTISNNIIRDILVDEGGNLWISTEDGLNHFDIQKNIFYRYKNDPDDPNSLSHNFVTVIYKDKYSQMWIGTQGGGLNLFDPQSQQFIQFRHNPSVPGSLSSNIVWDIAEDSFGNLWVATRTGLELFDRQSGEFLHYKNDPDDPFSLAENDVRVILEDQEHELWIGTFGGGLDRLNPNTGNFIHYKFDPYDPKSLSDDEVRTIFSDRSGVIWVGTSNGLNQYQQEFDNFIRYNRRNFGFLDQETLSSPTVLDIHQDESGVYWVATSGGGLNYFAHFLQQFTHIYRQPDSPNTLSSNHVSSILEDKNGIIWIGTDSGLNRYYPLTNSFVHYNHQPNDPESLTNDWITTLFQDQDGDLWVGTRQGLNIFDPRKNKVIPYRTKSIRDLPGLAELPSIDLSQVSITAMDQDDQGSIWLGSEGKGLIRLEPKNKRVIVYPSGETNRESLQGKTVLSIVVDRQGSIWIGTLRGGLSNFDPQNEFFTHFLENPGGPSSLSDNTVNTIFEDKSGVIWIGTTAGLNNFNPKTGAVTQYREKDGLPSDFIDGIIADDQGFLWISTNNGLSKFDPVQGTFKNFTQEDGLQSRQFNRGAYSKSERGILYFGGDSGINIFNPEQISENNYQPPILFTGLKQGGEDILLDTAPEFVEEITLSWPQNYFEFEFVSLNYVQVNENQFAYKLEGLDQEWISTGSRRYGRYTNLPGGKFTLHIIGSNNDGFWNKIGSTITVNVLPPFWETIWFQGSVVLVVAMGVFIGYQLRTRSINIRNQQLTSQIELRTQELEQRRQAAEGLREVLFLLNSNRSLEESLEFILCQIIQLTGAQNACVFQYETGSTIQFVTISSSQLLAARSCKQNERLTVEYPHQLLDWFAGLAKGSTNPVTTNAHSFSLLHPDLLTSFLECVETILIFPISLESENLFALVVMLPEQKILNEEEIGLVNTFADQASLAIGNAELRSQTEEMAIVAERNRLARDLHDAVTQTLFSASLIAEALPDIWISNRDEGLSLLEELRELNRSAIFEMRALLMELRPAALEESDLPELLNQLGELIAGRTEIDVKLDIQGTIQLPPKVKVVLYRIAQEATTNIVKHSHADQAILRLTSRESSNEDTDHEKIFLEIEDDGLGFDPGSVPADRFGLANMQERAEGIGAQVIILSQPGNGTSIQVTWEGETDNNG